LGFGGVGRQLPWAVCTDDLFVQRFKHTFSLSIEGPNVGTNGTSHGHLPKRT
jgi:hypothetical protein